MKLDLDTFTAQDIQHLIREVHPDLDYMIIKATSLEMFYAKESV
jgi:hypothetical protein